MLALCHDLKAADYAQNYAGIIFSGLLLIVVRPHYLHENSGMETKAADYAGIIFSGLLLIVVRPHYLHENSGMETIHTGWLVLTNLAL